MDGFLSRERNTSDARAVVLRQQDETTAVRSRVSSRHETHRKEEHTVRKESRREDQISRREEQNSRREEDSSRREEKREGTLYKRGELISSARSPPT